MSISCKEASGIARGQLEGRSFKQGVSLHGSLLEVIALSCMIAAALPCCQASDDVTGDGAQDDPAPETADTPDTPEWGETNPDGGCVLDADCGDADPCTQDLCDPATHSCTYRPRDDDWDGYEAAEVEGTSCGGDDCDDADFEIYAGAPIVRCSRIDHDCNGAADEDNDADGHLDWICGGGDDCDDADALVLRGECWGVGPCCDGCNQMGGCWYDETTGYIWQDPGPPEYMDVPSARSYCESLSLAGYGAGSFHLPTIGELRTLIRGCPETEVGGICGVDDSCVDYSDPLCYVDDDCNGCLGGNGPGAGGNYWNPALEGGYDGYRSSTWIQNPHPGHPSYWVVRFSSAWILWGPWESSVATGVRCVNTSP